MDMPYVVSDKFSFLSTGAAQLLLEPVVLLPAQLVPPGPRTRGVGWEEVADSTHCSWRYS